MTKKEILNELLNTDVPLNAQQMAHKLNTYGGNNMRQGIINIYYDALKKGAAIGAITTGTIAITAGVMISKLVITIKENTLKEQKKQFQQKNQNKLIQGELNEQKI